MGSQTGKTFIIYCLELKNLKVTSQVDHGSEVFGVCWNPSIRDEYLVACMNGEVHLCNMNKPGGPIKVFKGHLKRVFNVTFNEQVPNIFASGSDDLTIKIWDKESGAVLKTLSGHSHNVRAIKFNPELPWLLVSGSWDATIKLWDVRSGTCIYTISEHAADVYGISFHPKRPFIFVSSSRDTTLRFWSMDQLVTTLRIQLLLDPRNTKFYDSPQQAFTTKGEYRLSSPSA